MILTETLRACAAAACALLTAGTPGTTGISEAELKAKCEAEGGCVLVTREQMGQAMQYAFQQGIEAAAARLDSNGCLRGRT